MATRKTSATAAVKKPKTTTAASAKKTTVGRKPHPLKGKKIPAKVPTSVPTEDPKVVGGTAQPEQAEANASTNTDQQRPVMRSICDTLADKGIDVIILDTVNPVSRFGLLYGLADEGFAWAHSEGLLGLLDKDSTDLDWFMFTPELALRVNLRNKLVSALTNHKHHLKDNERRASFKAHVGTVLFFDNPVDTAPAFVTKGGVDYARIPTGAKEAILRAKTALDE